MRLTRAQVAAELNARAAWLNATVAGMQAENAERERNGEALAYDGRAFFGAVDEAGLNPVQIHNALHDPSIEG